jgi:hypothetical protein
MAWPVQIQVSVIGAVFAVAGYMLKSVIDWWQRKRKERAQTIAELQRLQSLLNGAWTVYSLQQDKVRDLMPLLAKNHPEEYRAGVGYEDKMAGCYTAFTDEEKKKHSIIRAYTQHSLRSVNLALSEWLRSDGLFKTGVVASRRRKQLAENLFALEMHLLLWHAKYESWIPDQPKHALVYMDDEEHHGLGFPKDRVEKDSLWVESVDKDVAAVLKELRGKWKRFSLFRD